MSEIKVAALGAMGWLAAASANAQTVLDRVDPAARAQPRAPEDLPTPAVKIDSDAPAAVVKGGDAGVLIGAVRFAGLQALTPADFADVVEPYLGRSASAVQLAALAEKAAARARGRGYVFASSSIEPQRLSAGVLTVTIDEGRIDEVRLDGPDQPAVRAALAPLANGRPVTLPELERRLLLAGDIDGVWVRSSRYLREAGRGVLLVKLVQTPVAGRIAITNDGTRPVGPDQAYLRLDINQLLFADDTVTVAYSGAIAEPEEYMAGRIRYAKRISPSGTELALSGSLSRARPGAYLSSLDIQGRTWSAAVALLQPLHRRR
jgi:hemolysin activation/secretion protein